MMLAGFEDPTSGTITLDGKRIDNVPGAQARHRHGLPELRPFPAHDRRAEPRVSAGDARRRQERTSSRGSGARSTWCACRTCASASPAQLSGGQQQRVAVARALVYGPKLVLMDEPLGALDKQLREQMQLEIKHLHDELGVTVVYVTHDQSEALTMSDRIAVFHHGRIQQLARRRASSTSGPPTRSSRRSSARTTASTARSSRATARPAACALRTAASSPPRPGPISPPARPSCCPCGRSA